MENKLKISIPEPCQENWNKMTRTATGKFCGVCTKTVVDFTAMLPTEIQHYFTANTSSNICGRFKTNQLEDLIIQVPSNVLYSQLPYHKAFLLALFIAMGTTLFSCKDTNGKSQNIDKVEVIDTTDVATIKVKPLPPKPIIGDTIMVKPQPPIKKSVKKGDVKCEQIPEEPQIMGLILPPAVIDTLKQPKIMGKVAPPKQREIMDESAVEETQPKPQK